MRAHADKIILYGSTARGEDTPDSDIDLLIIRDKLEKDETAKELKKVKLKKKINAEQFTPYEYEELKKKDPVYHAETDRGIVLWEKKDE